LFIKVQVVLLFDENVRENNKIRLTTFVNAL